MPLSGIVGRGVRLVRAGREFKGCCPFHNEKTPSFYVNDDKQFFHCFGCGAHGDIIGFTMRRDGVGFLEAVESLAAQAGLSVPRDAPVERERYDREKRLYQLMESATLWFEARLRDLSLGREAMRYLRGRGLSDEALARFRIGYAPQDTQMLQRAMAQAGFSTDEMLATGLIKKSEGREGYFSFFRNRVMFPVGDRRGRVVAFGGRVMGDGEPKYLNSPDNDLFHKGKLLYGLSRAREAARQRQPVVVVEGYMDVIAMAEAGYCGAVAPLGTALTEDQIALLWQLAPAADARDPAIDYSPILCFDGDNAGFRAAARAVERVLPLLTTSRTARIARLPEGDDPDSLIRNSGKMALQAVLDQAKPMFDAVWDSTLAGRRVDTPESRGEFMRVIRERAARIQDETLRRLYQDEVNKRLEAAFGWGGNAGSGQRRQYGGGRGAFPARTGGGRGGGRPIASARQWGGAGIAAAKPPPNAADARAKALLAIMVNHPAIFADFGEDLARIGFSNPRLEALRQQLVDILSHDSQETLDADGLYRHLSDGNVPEGARLGLSEVVAAKNMEGLGFARPDRPVDEARRGWKSIWNGYLKECLLADLQAATRLYDEEPSDVGFERMRELQAQVLSCEAAEYVGDDGSAEEQFGAVRKES